MVTKLSGTVVEYSAEGMFQYKAGLTSGLNVTVSEGSFMEATGLVEYPETSFLLTDDAINYIFINLDVTPATLVASTTLPTEGLILLRITTASGVVSTAKDYRWRQFASRLLVPPVGNQLYETLADADHLWQFKDFTTAQFEDVQFDDDGTSASPVHLIGDSASTSAATNIPGRTRGAPYEPGVSISRNSGGLSNTRASPKNHIANTATGAWGLWVKPDLDMPTLSANPYTMMMQRFSSNNALSIGWAIKPDGSIYAWMDSNVNQVTYQTTTGLVTPGAWNFICINQPGDGGGFDVYVDGVAYAATPTIGGTGSLDDWIDRLYTDFVTPTDFYVNSSAIHTGVASFLPGQYFSPFVFESALDASTIAAIHDAANPTGDAEDVRTWITDNIDPDYHWSMSLDNLSGYLASSGRKHASLQPSGTMTWTTGPWTDTDINHFHNVAADFSGAGSPTFFPPGTPSLDNITDDTVGAWAAWVRTPSSLATERYFISAGPSSVANCSVGINASGKFFGILSLSSGNYTQLTATGITLSTDTWYFVVFQQTGSSHELYIDGTQVTGGNLTKTQAGTGADTDWLGTIPAWTTDNTIRFSGTAGSSSLRNWGDGRLGDFIYHGSFLTSTQIANMHAAANGTFN